MGLDMNNYIFAGRETPELVDMLNNNKALALVRELNFKYKLAVVGVVEQPIMQLGIKADQNRGFIVGLGEGNMAGIPIGIAYVSTTTEFNEDHNLVTKTEYAYQSEYISKMRASSQEDRSTYKSIKLASLLGTIKRQEAIPSPEIIFRRISGGIHSGIDMATSELRNGRSSKHIEMTGDQFHAMLKTVVNGDALPLNLIDICKIELDKLNTIDKNVSHANSEIDRMFGKSFYALGANKYREKGGEAHSDLVLAVCKYTDDRVEILKPIKHLKSLADVPELIPVMTMLKVSIEDKQKELINDCIPLVAAFFEELDMAVDYNRYPTMYEYIWAITPCGEDVT